MPYELKKVGKLWSVINTQTGEVHSKGTTKAKAEAQIRLLEQIKHGGMIGPGEQPLIESMRINRNPTVAVPHGEPHSVGFGIGGPYDRFINSRHPAFRPQNKKPLFQQE